MHNKIRILFLCFLLAGCSVYKSEGRELLISCGKTYSDKYKSLNTLEKLPNCESIHLDKSIQPFATVEELCSVASSSGFSTVQSITINNKEIHCIEETTSEETI